MMKLQQKVMREPLLGTLKRPGPSLPLRQSPIPT
jgi:hypothetical protein